MMLGLARPDAGSVSLFGLTPAEAVEAGRGRRRCCRPASLIRVPVGPRAGRRWSPRSTRNPLAVDEVLRADRNRRVRRPADQQALRRPDPAGALRDRARRQPRPARARRADRRRSTSRGAATSGTAMRAFAARGKTVVFATHYLEEADAYADRIILMARGRIVADGPPDRDQGDGRAAHDPRHAARRRPAALAALPGVDERRAPRRGVVLTARDSDAALRALLARYPEAATSRYAAPGLEEAFLELTGDDDDRRGVDADERARPTSATRCCAPCATAASSSSRSVFPLVLFFAIAGARTGTRTSATASPSRSTT